MIGRPRGRPRISRSWLPVASWLLAVAVASALVVVGRHLGTAPAGLGNDAYTYWEALRSTDPYENAVVGAEGAYLYSPLFLQLLRPAALLPADAFVFAWTAGLLVIAAVLGRRAPAWGRLPLAIAVTVAMLDIWGGNIHLLLAAAIVIGLRRPAGWAVPLLTKVTPGLGVLWFAARGEWAKVRAAAAGTLTIIGLSALLDPFAWVSWLGVLLHHVNPVEPWGAIPMPFLLRAPVGLVIVAWAAQTNRRWALPVGCLVLMPVIWPGAFALLLACAALAEPVPAWRSEIRAWAARSVAALSEGLRRTEGGALPRPRSLAGGQLRGRWRRRLALIRFLSLLR